MMLGAMNDPRRPLAEEIHALAAAGMGFADLTLEPPGADPDALPLSETARALRDTRLGVVGHAPASLPIASPFAEVRRAAREVLSRCLEAYAALGARLVTIHPDAAGGHWSPAEAIAVNAEAVAGLVRSAEAVGVRLAVENVPGLFNEVESLQPLLAIAPEVGFHLHLGRAALQPRLAGDVGPSARVGALLQAFGARLCHVHLCDNLCGYEDLHLPVGAGRIPWADEFRRLRAIYDGFLTLDIHPADQRYLHASVEVVRRLWAEAAAWRPVHTG